VRILPPEPYRTPDISNGFVVRSELTQMHRTFPDADLESIRLTLDQIGVQRSQTVLTSSPEWAVLLLYQGAHVIFLSKDADRLRRLRDGYTSVVGIARKQGGLLQIVEGDITDPAVLVYLGDWHGFDHIALLSGASAEVLARLKKPGQGTFYQGPFLNEREASLFSESLRRSGVVLGENRPVLMPGSGNNYYGRVYPLGLARGKTPPSSLSESKISSADQTPRSRWDRWTGGYINRISLWAARWVTCDPYRAWGLSLLIFMTRNAARAEGMQGVAPPSKFSFFLVAALFAMMLTGAIRWFLANPPFEHPPVRITWADYRTEKKRSVNDFALTKEPVDDWEYRSTHYRWSLYEAPWRHVFAISAGLTGAAILSLTFVLGFPDRASPEEFVLLFTLGVASLCSWAAVRLSLDANGWQTAGKSAIRNYSGALSRLETLLVRKQRQVIRLFLAGVAASTALLIYDIYLIARRPPSVFDHLSRADSAAYRVWSTAA